MALQNLLQALGYLFSGTGKAVSEPNSAGARLGDFGAGIASGQQYGSLFNVMNQANAAGTPVAGNTANMLGQGLSLAAPPQLSPMMTVGLSPDMINAAYQTKLSGLTTGANLAQTMSGLQQAEIANRLNNQLLAQREALHPLALKQEQIKTEFARPMAQQELNKGAEQIGALQDNRLHADSAATLQGRRFSQIELPESKKKIERLDAEIAALKDKKLLQPNDNTTIDNARANLNTIGGIHRTLSDQWNRAVNTRISQIAGAGVIGYNSVTGDFDIKNLELYNTNRAIVEKQLRANPEFAQLEATIKDTKKVFDASLKDFSTLITGLSKVETPPPNPQPTPTPTPAKPGADDNPALRELAKKYVTDRTGFQRNINKHLRVITENRDLFIKYIKEEEAKHNE